MTVEVAKTRCCPDCGTALSTDGDSQGLCPGCLMELALESPTLLSEILESSEAPTLGFVDHGLVEGQVQGDRYRIRSLLGRGGMGEVWRAYDLKLRQDVAIKSLRQELIEDPRALETLRQEVRAAREVISPNVCRVFDLQELDGQELVSMEYIDGVTLHEVLVERSPLELDEAREIASQFLAGLEAIHDADLVHQDIKPENIMVTRTGRVVVMDFGLAKGLQEGRSGQVAGTPAYMSPEQSGGGDQDARSDVYSAGVVLAEMVTPGGIRTFEERRRIWEGIHRDTPEIAETPWARVINKALETDPGGRFNSAAQLARALEEVTLRAVGDESAHPYPGLSTFQLEDAEYFFGRELEVEALWKKLRRPHLLAVIGPSGAGKSSFLRAGLLPTLTDGWGAIVTTPGSRPFANLARALASELTDSADHTDRLLRFEEPDVAVDLISEWRSQHERTLIILDQFEELFTQNPDETQQRFAELLGRLPLEADVHVLLAMRDDFLFHCHRFEAFTPILTDLTLLGPPTGASLRRAIVQPALKCGYRFEDESLVEEMLSEVEGERGSLPMVAFAAAKLWDSRDREEGFLTREAYESIGGVGGALAQHAEATLEQIGEEHIAIVRELFRNLVTAQGTRAARDRDDLLSVFSAAHGASVFRSAAHHSAGDTKTDAGGQPEGIESTAPAVQAAGVLDSLVDARLLTSFEVPSSDEENAPHHRIEIIHESLLSHWPRLVRWQTQDQEGAQLRDELRHQAHLWQEKGRPDDLLWTGTAFREYQLWHERYPGGLTATEEAFAAAMTHHAERRKRRRRIAVAATFVVLLSVVAIIGGFWRRSVAAARRAEAANLNSLGQLRLDEHPTAALAYATASLDLVDSQDARRLALEALGRGSPETRLPSGSHYSIEFSPDGRWLALADPWSGCTIWPWDGSSPIALEGSNLAMEVQISPNSDLVATTMDRERQQVGLWSLPEGRFLRSFTFAEGITLWYHFSPDGQRLLTPTEIVRPDHVEFEFRSWPVDGGEPDLLARVVSSKESVASFAGFDPANGRLAWVDGERLNIAPFKGPRADLSAKVSLEHDSVIAMAAFDPEGRRLATVDQSHSLRIWSLEHDPPKVIREMDHPGGGFGLLRFDPSAAWLADWGWQVWNLEAPADAAPLPIYRLLGIDGEHPGYGMAFDPTGKWLATGGSRSVSLWFLDPTSPHVLRGHESYPNGQMKFTGESDRLVSMSSEDGSVRLWSLNSRSGEQSRVLYQSHTAARFPNVIDLHHDAAIVAVGTPAGKVIVLPFDGGPGRELSGFTDAIQSIAVGPRGRLVAAGAGVYAKEQAVIRVWDLEAEETRILDVGDGKAITFLKFGGKDDLWSGNGDELRRWGLETNVPSMVDTFDLSAGTSSGARMRDLDPVERRVLFNDGDRAELWIRDLDAGASRQLTSHGNGIRKARFDSTGELVVSADRFGAVRIGRVTGEEPHLLLGHEPEVNTVTVSGDGRWIASGADDRTVRVWPMPDLDSPPMHTLPRDDLLGKLRALTNIRVARGSESSSGWSVEIGPFPGWEEVPEW